MVVHPVSHRVPRVLRYSGSSRIPLAFRLRDSHPLWPAFPCRSAKLWYLFVSPQPRRINPPVWPLPRSLATTGGISVDVFSSSYLDVSVQTVPHLHLWIQCRLLEYCSSGLPHSEIPGSMDICSSPRLIAACRVLHRLLMPRHSPCALSSLTSSTQAPYPSLPLRLLFLADPLALGSARRENDGSCDRCSHRLDSRFLALLNYAGNQQ